MKNRERDEERERQRRFLESLTFCSFSVSWTPFTYWVIAYGDLCLRSFPLITFTFSCCQCSDRQPSGVPQWAIHLALTLSLQLVKEALPTPSTICPHAFIFFRIEIEFGLTCRPWLRTVCSQNSDGIPAAVISTDLFLSISHIVKHASPQGNCKIFFKMEIFDKKVCIIQPLCLCLCNSSVSAETK